MCCDTSWILGDGGSTQQRIRLLTNISQPVAQQLTLWSGFMLWVFWCFFATVSIHWLTAALLSDSLNVDLHYIDSHHVAEILAVYLWNRFSLLLRWRGIGLTQILNTSSLDRPSDWRIERLILVCHPVYMSVERHSVYTKSYPNLVILYTVYKSERKKEAAFWL